MQSAKHCRFTAAVGLLRQFANVAAVNKAVNRDERLRLVVHAVDVLADRNELHAGEIQLPINRQNAFRAP